MTSAALSCPFCNAFLPAAAAGGPPNPLFYCPRCGEKLPARLTQAIQARATLAPRTDQLAADEREASQEDDDADATPSAPAPSPVSAGQSRPEVSTPADLSRRLRRSVAVVLAIMAAMVVLGLWFAWSTEDFRRAHDLHRPERTRLNVMMLLIGVILVGSWSWMYYVVLGFLRKRQAVPSTRQEVGELIVFVLGLMVLVVLLLGIPRSLPRSTPEELGPEAATLPPRPVPIFELPALDYLAPETGAVLAVRVAEAEKTAAGKEFLKHGRLGPINLSELEKWTGLPLDAVDHVVLGLKVDNRLPPPLVLVVQARRPLEPDKIRQALKSVRSSEVGSKTLHHFTTLVGKLSLEASIWFASADTLVVAISKGDLEALPDKPALGSRLAAPLQAVLRERTDPAAQAVLAGAADTWDPFVPLLSLALAKEDLDTVTRVRAFGFWLRFDDGVRFQGTVRCANEAAARALEAKWAQLKVPEGNALPKEWLPLVRELSERFTCERQETWVNIQAEAGAQAVRKALAK